MANKSNFEKLISMSAAAPVHKIYTPVMEITEGEAVIETELSEKCPLDSSHEMGKLIIPTSAVRDEGTSYHNLPPSREVAPTDHTLETVKTTLVNAGLPFELIKTWESHPCRPYTKH